MRLIVFWVTVSRREMNPKSINSVGKHQGTSIRPERLKTKLSTCFTFKTHVVASQTL